MGVKHFKSITEIIQAYQKFYPNSDIRKVSGEENQLFLEIKKENNIIERIRIRDCQGSKYYSIEFPDTNSK